jgi:hypothetical protein
MVNVKKLPTWKDNISYNILETFFAHKLSTLCLLFLNGKCENTDSESYFHLEYFGDFFLAHKLSIHFPLYQR